MEAPLSSSSCTKFEIDKIPRETIWGGLKEFVQCEGFWNKPDFLEAAIAAKSNFVARDEDVILASSMKTGTTWLKALIPSIMKHDLDDDPFVKNHPNQLIPYLEIQIFCKDSKFDLSTMPSPRLFRTHAPFPMLADSIKDSSCKIVYITRNPKDVFVSLWHFYNTIWSTSHPMDEAFESFCRGIHHFGPFHDHVLGYWQASVEKPQKILFLKYEDLKNDPVGQVQKLASFLGRPILKVEDVEKIMWKCNIERLLNLEINKNGVDPSIKIPYKSYLRLGVVGDWKNHLTNEMKARLDELPRMKFEGSGLHL